MDRLSGWTRRLGRGLAPLGAGLVLACGSGAAGTDQILPAAAARDLRIEVQNQSYFDAELYALMGTGRRRLGFVRGHATEHFAFDWPPDRGLVVEIELKLIGIYQTDPLPVEEGDDLLLVIEPGLHLRPPIRRR